MDEKPTGRISEDDRMGGPLLTRPESFKEWGKREGNVGLMLFVDAL